MTKELIILFIITLIYLTCGLSTDIHHQSKYPRHEFILYKCIATVQLNRKHQNEEAPNISSNKHNENLFQRAYTTFKMQERNSNF